MAETPEPPTSSTGLPASKGRANISGEGRDVLHPWLARALVFGTSAAVLVIEILAGRLLAPHIGVSLDTFTGIIGVILAAIAVGAWGGGRLADQHDARQLIGPAIVAGGALTWMSLLIVHAMGSQFGDGPEAIVILATSAFFLPAVALSAVGPMVAKLQLGDLGETGSIIGGLSATGTIGALAGTFITGFVLISAVATRPIVMTLGAVLVVAGGAVHWRLASRPSTVAAAAVLLVGSLTVLGATSSCQHETAYACINIVADPDNESGRSLYLDRLRHAYVDLDDPTNLDIRYIRLFAQISDAAKVGPLKTLHLGGGGFSFPRYLNEARPGTTSLVLEIDAELTDIARAELGLVTNDQLVVHTGDARLGLDDLETDWFDLVMGDAFGGASVPWHLTTREFLQEIDRVLSRAGSTSWT
jgi:MFS family permease